MKRSKREQPLLLIGGLDPLHPVNHIKDVQVEHIPLTLDETTFVGGLQAPVHRWYRLRPSFSPQLVVFLLDVLSANKSEVVFDPFAGAGTTVIESALHGYQSIGVEVNPFLVEYANRALEWDVTIQDIEKAFQESKYLIEENTSKAREIGLAGVCSEFSVAPPPIHNVFRWWREDVLAELLAVKASLLGRANMGNLSPLSSRLLWLVLGTVCIEVANIKRLHPTLSFYDRSKEKIDVQAEMLKKLTWIAEDLKIASQATGRGKVLLGNSCHLEKLISSPMRACIITSPPYANRYSYVWETRPHLYMMDLISTAKEATQLDLESIGGTWGTATSILMKGEIEPRTSLLKKELASVLEALRPLDNLMANYVVKYFNMMDMHLESLYTILASRSRLAYVIGNSRLKGIDIPTERVLLRQLQDKGFHIEKVFVFRKRIGKRSLYESVIVGQL